MVNKILVKHSRVELYGYEPGDSPKLEYLFSVYKKMIHMREIKGIVYDESKKILYVPRGADVSFFEDLFHVQATVDYTPDNFVDSDYVGLKYLPKDERQRKILNFITGIREYSYTKSYSQLCVNSATGSGKTYVTIAAMAACKMRVAIITSTMEWLNQWGARVLEYTSLNSDEIYMISGKQSINKIKCIDPLKYTVFLISHETIKSYGDSYGWDKVEELFKYLRIRMKVFDEAHLYFDNMCMIDYHTNVKQTLYLTATLGRSDKEEDRIFGYYFKNMPKISLYDEVNDPHVHYVAIHFNSHPSYKIISSFRTQVGFDRNKYMKWIIHQPNFKKLLSYIIDFIFTSVSGKTLIFIGVNDSIDYVYEYLLEQFPFLDGWIGIYTSKTPKAEKDRQKEMKIILSTTKSAGTASDIYDLKCTINLAEPFVSKILAQQTLGRCREEGFYLDIVDDGFYSTKNYYKQKQTIFSEFAKSMQDIYLNDDQLEKLNYDVLDKFSSTIVPITPVYL